MRYLVTAAISGAAIFAVAPAAAQTGSPGAVYHNQGPIPGPGGMVRGQPQRYNPPQVRGPSNPPRVDVRQQRPGAPGAASRVWQNGRWNSLPANQHGARPHNPNRWRYDRGRWDGGNRAPGGWNSYRRLNRGHRLPQYWLQASFGIPDYLSYGLAAPPYGYHWSRYYDDAVLVDYQGNVWDSIDGISWSDTDGYADGYAGAESYSYSSDGYAPRIEPVDPGAYYDQPAYPGGYAPPVVFAPPAVQVQGFQGYGYGSGYAASGYYTAPTTSTSVTYITLPGTTTTTVTEEIIEESVTTSYVRAAPRKIRRAPVKRYRAKPKCCVCVCR